MGCYSPAHPPHKSCCGKASCCMCGLQVSSLSAQVLALRAERDQLQEHCQREGASSSNMQQQLQEQVIGFTATCRAKDQEVAHVNTCLQNERRERVGTCPKCCRVLPCALVCTNVMRDCANAIRALPAPIIFAACPLLL